MLLGKQLRVLSWGTEIKVISVSNSILYSGTARNALQDVYLSRCLDLPIKTVKLDAKDGSVLQIIVKGENRYEG